jgi:hypothetical protein
MTTQTGGLTLKSFGTGVSGFRKLPDYNPAKKGDHPNTPWLGRLSLNELEHYAKTGTCPSEHNLTAIALARADSLDHVYFKTTEQHGTETKSFTVDVTFRKWTGTLRATAMKEIAARICSQIDGSDVVAGSL